MIPFADVFKGVLHGRSPYSDVSAQQFYPAPAEMSENRPAYTRNELIFLPIECDSCTSGMITSTRMLLKGVTLRGLEVFETLASTGSVAKTSELTGLSQPAVSQQLRNLEKSLGADLVDHTRRPMRLTHTGHNFLDRVSTALETLRRAQSEVSALELGQLEALNIGIHDELATVIPPALISHLANVAPGAKLSISSADSADLMADLTAKALHLVIASGENPETETQMQYPLMHDPLLVVFKKGGSGDLARTAPFIARHAGQQSRQTIDALLAAEGIATKARVEISCAQSALAFVAREGGITVASTLAYLNARQIHGQLDARLFSASPPTQRWSLFTSSEWAGALPLGLAEKLRQALTKEIIQPGISTCPWLADHLKLADHPPNN
jgi:DNA-binding transcriptional LysR family regulator